MRISESNNIVTTFKNNADNSMFTYVVDDKVDFHLFIRKVTTSYGNVELNDFLNLMNKYIDNGKTKMNFS